MKAVILNKFNKSFFKGAEYDCGWLLPVAGISIAEHMVKILKKCGIKNIYMIGRAVSDYDDGQLYEYRRLGINVCENVDEKCFIKGSTIVVEKTGVFTSSFNEIIDFHMRNRSLVTCVQNKNSQTGIIENTGIYIFEPDMFHLIHRVGKTASLGDITAGEKISRYGKRIMNYEVFDSWHSVDDRQSYINTNVGFISSDKSFNSGNFIRDGVFVGRNSMVADSAVLIPPVMIGENCIIGSGCNLSGSITGNDVILESTVTVINSILMNNISAGNHVSIKNSIIADGAKLRDSFKAEDCVIGKRCVCKTASAVMAGASTESDMVIENGCVVNKEKIEGCGGIPEFDECGLKFDFFGSCSLPESFAKLGASLGSFFGFTSTVIIGSDTDELSMICAGALSSGLMFSGVNVKHIDDTVLPVMRWVCRQGLADGGIYISANETEKIYILNNYGNDIPTSDRRRVIKIFSCNSITEMPQKFIGKSSVMTNPEEFYTANISDLFPEAYKSLKLGMPNVKGEIKDVVCAVFASKLYPDAPVFVPDKAFLAVSKILGNKADIIRCNDIKGDIMAEMERFMGVPGVYQQYLMMFDDFAFELAVSHYKALFGLEEIRKIVIPRVFHKSAFIGCEESGENDFYDYLTGDKYIRKHYEVGESLRKNNAEGSVVVTKNPLRRGIQINIDCYREEYADEITDKINKIFMEYSGK